MWLERMDGSTLEARRSARSPSGAPRRDRDVDAILDRENPRRLVCRACGATITADTHRISIEGHHIHQRTNPAGFEFEIGCFSQAPGAATVGEATSEHTWFTGLCWCFSICLRCDSHLGWFFAGSGTRFHGLILDRLTEANRSQRQ